MSDIIRCFLSYSGMTKSHPSTKAPYSLEMYCFRLTLAATIFILIDSAMSTNHDSKETMLSKLITMPLKQLILSRDTIGEIAMTEILLDRPEFQCRDWTAMQANELAEHLWSLQKDDTSDMPYHRKLNTAYRDVMILHSVQPDVIARVMETVSSYIRQTRKREHHRRRKGRNLSQEEQGVIRLQRLRKSRHKRKQKALGLGFPLLSYMGLPMEVTLAPSVIHEVALKYRNKYWSCRSFIHALKQMWKTLGFEDSDVTQQLLDKRNYTFPTWPQRKRAGRVRMGKGSIGNQRLASQKVFYGDDENAMLHYGIPAAENNDKQVESAAPVLDCDLEWLQDFPELPDLLIPPSSRTHQSDSESAWQQPINLPCYHGGNPSIACLSDVPDHDCWSPFPFV